MRYFVKFRGEPIRAVDGLVEGYILIRDEFKKRWPRAFYGPQEAAAHGFELCGQPELTPDEAAELRAAHRRGGEPSATPRGTLAEALRQGLT